MTEREDLYVILDVRPTASVNDIKRAFRRLARRYHPDINPGDGFAEEQFKRITEAYEVLSNPLKREFYDVNGFYTEGVLEEQKPASGWSFSFKGFEFSRSEDVAFGEIFKHIFELPEARREPARGEDLEYQVTSSFEEALRGLTRRITVLRQEKCEGCSGSGRHRGVRETSCRNCGGNGKTSKIKGHLQFDVTCTECRGTGTHVQACKYCRGEGRVPVNDSFDVVLPPGVATGSRIPVAGKGNAGRFGGPSGDLYVVTNPSAHAFLERIGDNIHCRVPLTVTEAALGAKVEVPTLDGPAIVRIPPGTQTGQIFRLRGRGTPSLLNPGLRGDQYVEVKVMVPKIADERSKEILRELAKLNPEDPRKGLWNGT